MSGCWAILELEPTRDISAIKRAYAGKARTCHPEEDPGGFLKLRRAYEAALDYAENGLPEARPSPVQMESTVKQGNCRADNRGGLILADETDSQEEAPPDPPAAPEDDGWYFQDKGPETLPNPYADSEAIRKFLDLYTGKQRKDSQKWMEYFTSDGFLAAGWDPLFTALLLEKVTEVEQSLPPYKEFLMWLSTAYQFTIQEELAADGGKLRIRNRKADLCPGAEFEGMESILRIAAKGPLPKRPGGDELALRESFQDYRHLVRLAESGAWNVQAMEEYQNILRRYVPFYIKDRCDPKANMDHQRHPAGLRLLLHFFRREDLPETVYREAWRELDLKSAIMGRAKILYGPLRELVLERVPGIAGEKPENFLQLNRDHDAYRARIAAEPEREDQESAAFFQREELQTALRSPRFVAEQLLRCTNWRRDGMGVGLVRRMLEFYRENPDIPRAGEAAKGLEEDLRARMAKVRNREDAEAFHGHERLTMQDRPLVRYWLNAAFFIARDPETGTTLLEYLDKNLPYQADWSRRFAQREDGSRTAAAMRIGEVEVGFYPRHIEYRVGGRPAYRPCLSFKRAAEESGDGFFLLLPLAAEPEPCFPGVYQEILLRIGATAVPEEDREFVARCLAGAVCCLPTGEYTGEPVPLETVLPLTLFAETEEQLFGCSWMEGAGELMLFEQTASGRRVRKLGEAEPENAEAEARRLLAEAVSPSSFRLPMREAPWHIYYMEDSGPEQEWLLPEEPDPEGLEHTIEHAAEIMRLREEQKKRKCQEAEGAISSLLARFGRSELRRLELSWFEGQLVFLKEEAGYACLYFEDHVGFDIWYAVLSQPEVYRTAEDGDTRRVPFGLGTLPEYVVHKGPGSILREAERIFGQLAAGRPQAQGAGGWLWDSHTNRQDGRHKLLMARQKAGGMPPRRSHERMEAKYVFSRYPVEIEKETLAGEAERREIRSGDYGLAAAALLEFMSGKLTRLRLTWAFKASEPVRRHMVLLHDQGRFLMAWLQDDRERADVCRAESSKAEEERFLGGLVPGTLIHQDLWTIRNCVDLLLDDIDCAEPVIKRYFLPAARPYEELRPRLVRD